MMHEMSYLIRVDPAKAKAKILDALRKSGMHRGNAATVLECRLQTLSVWIDRLELGPTVERMTKEAQRDGWYAVPKGGRPRDSAKVRRAKEKGLIPRAPRVGKVA